MNIMQKLTVRQMLLNKRRTIVTILGIMFSVALFTSVSIILPSFMEMFQRAEIQQSGNWHTIYNHVTASDLPVITEDESTAETAVFLREGVSRLEIPVEGRQFVSFQRVNESGFFRDVLPPAGRPSAAKQQGSGNFAEPGAGIPGDLCRGENRHP